MKDPVLNEIMIEVAEETGLTVYEVELMFESQFKFAKTVMCEKEGESIMFRVLGKFLVNGKRLKYLKEMNVERD